VPARVFSRPFISVQGGHGHVSTVTVPLGHVYVVKTLCCFASPLVGEIRILFRSVSSGATLWHQRIDIDETDSRQLVECSIAFLQGEQFEFEVIRTAPDEADVFAGGYDLLMPS
jgi:hypothetical protein